MHDVLNACDRLERVELIVWNRHDQTVRVHEFIGDDAAERGDALLDIRIRLSGLDDDPLIGNSGPRSACADSGVDQPTHALKYFEVAHERPPEPANADRSRRCLIPQGREASCTLARWRFDFCANRSAASSSTNVYDARS